MESLEDKWSSILHFSTGKDKDIYGSRTPAVLGGLEGLEKEPSFKIFSVCFTTSLEAIVLKFIAVPT